MIGQSSVFSPEYPAGTTWKNEKVTQNMWGPYSASGYPYEEEEVWAPQIAGWYEASVPWVPVSLSMTRFEKYVCVYSRISLVCFEILEVCGKGHL